MVLNAKYSPPQFEPMVNKKVLVADDEPGVRVTISEYLLDSDFEVTLADDGPRAISILKKESFDIVITDLAMPGMDGIELIRFLNRQFPDLPVIVVSASLHAEAYRDTVKQYENIYETFPKPVDLQILESSINKALGLKE